MKGRGWGTGKSAFREAPAMLFVSILFGIGVNLAPIVPAPAPIQEAVRPQKPIQHEVGVTLKLIQVIVLDKQGNPVTDLGKEDFVLTDNGREMKLTEFERHVLPIVSAEAPAEGKVAATALPPPRMLNRKFFLLFDFAYNNPAGVRKMPEIAEHFLETKILPMDEVGVLSYSTLNLLQVHLYLTTDHQKVRDFISRIGLRDSSQRFEDLEDKYQRELESGGLADARPETKLTRPGPEMPGLDREAMWLLTIKDYTHSLTALAYALRAVEGQKHLVLFSEGIPYPQLYGPMASAVRHPWEILLKELQTSNVQVHSLYTGGITLSDWLTGAWTLAKTSYETGGQYWGNMFNYEPFVDKLQTTTGSYYVLGYPVGEAWDGAYHRIHVTVKRPDVRIRAQWGYSNPKPFADYSDLEKRIQLVDLALADRPISQTPASFELAVLPFCADPAGNVLFAARIPRETLDAVAGKKVEVVGLVFNGADEIVSLYRNEEDLTRIDPAGAALLSVLAVPPGTYRFRVVIRNLETGAAARAGITTAVPEAIASGVTLLPPVLWKPERGAFYLKGFAPKATGKAPLRPLLEVLGVDTRQYVPYTEKTLASPSEIWVSIRCAVPENPASKVRLSASLEDLEFGGTEAVPLEILAEKDEPAGKAYFLRLDIPEVEPGKYRLYLRAEESASGRTSVLANDFEIDRPIPNPILPYRFRYRFSEDRP
jgi:VWFA-related protein